MLEVTKRTHLLVTLDENCSTDEEQNVLQKALLFNAFVYSSSEPHSYDFEVCNDDVKALYTYLSYSPVKIKKIVAD